MPQGSSPQGRDSDRRAQPPAFDLRPATPAIGAVLDGVDLVALTDDDGAFAALQRALVRYQVLFLPAAHIEPLDLQRLACRFGPVLAHPAYPRVEGAPQVQILESTAQSPSKIELWHSDMTFAARPPAITLLHAQIVPPVGGDTVWASAAAAFDALSSPLQAMLRTLRAVHDFRHGFRESLAQVGGPQRLAEAIAGNPPVQHPVVTRHPDSGREALFVNPLFTTHIEGLNRFESEDLLQLLYRQLAREEFTVRLRWQPGTLAIWDNRSTLHRPVNDFGGAHRKHHRVTIAALQSH